MKRNGWITLMLALLLVLSGCGGRGEAVTAGGVQWLVYEKSDGSLRIEPDYLPVGERGRALLSSFSGKVTVPAEIGGRPVSALCDNAFLECGDLQELVLPEGLESIGKNAFYGCGSLTAVTLPESLLEIGQGAFQHTGLRQLRLPARVFTLGPSEAQPFFGCASLSEIIVASENGIYASEGGVLFDKEKKTLLCYPAQRAGRAYTVPDTVQTVAEGAFSQCAGLESLTLPRSVQKLNSRFFGCTALRVLRVPSDAEAAYRENPALANFSGEIEPYD